MKKLLLLTSLVSMLSLWNEIAVSANTFSDVSAASPYLSYINDLQRLGITEGISPGQFGPSSTMTRAQFAKFVAVAFQINDDGTSAPFIDVQGHWAAHYIRAVYQAGVVNGTSSTTFSPEQPVKREEAAAMIWRLATKKGIPSPGKVKFQVQPDPWAIEAVNGVISNGWFGDDARQLAGGWTYRPLDNMTRQEMAALLVHSMKDLPGSTWTAAPADNAAVQDTTLPTWQQSLKSHLLNQDTTFEITLDNPNEFNQIKGFVDKLMADNDYLHYIYDGMKYKFDGISTTTFNVSYLESKSQSDYVSAQAKVIVGSIISPNMNDFEKEKAIHDYVVSNLAYDQSLTDHTAYGGLTKGTTVCQGYALLTYRLLTEANIPNKIVEGRAGGQLHTWNLVNIDNSWYHLDTTWDDPVPDVKGRLTYNYFNLMDNEIRHDHSWVAGDYPTANKDFIQTVQQAVQSGKMDISASQALLDSTGLSAETSANVSDSLKVIQSNFQHELAAKNPQITVRYKSSLGSAATVMKNALTNDIMFNYNVAKVRYEYNADTRLPGYNRVTVYITYG
jgi:hypothetical protein